MIEARSLRARLLWGLLGSLTLLLAAGFAALLVLQKQIMETQFDRESFRAIAQVMREVGRHGPAQAALPERLAAVTWLDERAQEASWSLPEGAAVAAWLADLGVDPAAGEELRPFNAEWIDGRRVRVYLRNFRRFGRRREGAPASGSAERGRHAPRRIEP